MLIEPYNPQMETETEYSQTSTHNICIIISYVSVFVVLIYEYMRGNYTYMHVCKLAVTLCVW